MKVIIAGSRGIQDYSMVEKAVRESGFTVTEVVSGTASGVDRLGERWAREHGVPVKQFPANWDELGKRAGYLRNAEMVTYAEALIAVWDGRSPGTNHTVKLAREAGLPVHVMQVDDRMVSPPIPGGKTKVIHIRESTKSSDEVYIGRAGKGADGYFGNPVRKGYPCPECRKVHQQGGDTLHCFKNYLMRRIQHEPEFSRRVRDLHGKTLVCFCKPNPCHGDVLSAAAALLQSMERHAESETGVWPAAETETKTERQR